MLRAAEAGKALLIAALAAEGMLLLGPGGAMVRAAQVRVDHSADRATYWWRKSPVHMGCSISWCERPATRTATYRIPERRGATWRAYGFCDRHAPPPVSAGLVYRQGRPPSFGYDVPLGPFWSQIYFLLGIAGFAIWAAGMWRFVRPATPARWLGLLLLQGAALAVLWYV